MKRLWYLLLGLPGLGLATVMLGPTVWGQPDAPKKGGALPVVQVNAPRDQTPPPPQLEVPQFPAVPIPPKSGPAPVVGTVQWADPPSTPTPPAPKAQTPIAPPPQIAPPPIAPPASNTSQVSRQQPTVTIEWIAPPTIRVNQPLPCQIVVRNSAATTVNNVVVRHKLPQGVTCKSAEPAATTESGEMVWNIGTLNPDQTRKIDLVLVTPTRGQLNCQANVSFSAVAGHQIQVREPQLSVKIKTPDKIVIGENVTLNFAVHNPGDGMADTVKLKATLPEGLEYVRGPIAEFDVGNLAPKEMRTVQVTCVAKGTGVQKCSASVTGDGNLSANDTCQFDILIPKLDVVMVGPKLRYLDRKAVYTLKVTNPGSAPANNVEVAEIIPAGFKFEQANHGGQFHEPLRQVTWKIGDLQPGETKEVNVDLLPIATGEFRFVALAKAARGLKSEADTRTVVEGLPSLSIDVSHRDDPIEVGAETVFEIRLVNTGTKPETNVQVSCTLPDQLEFKGAKCLANVNCRQEGRDLIFEPLTKLAPRADVIYRVTVRGTAPGDVRFRTRIRSEGLREPVLREESIRIYSDGAPERSTPSVPTPPAPSSSTTPSTTPPAPVLPTPLPVPPGTR